MPGDLATKKEQRTEVDRMPVEDSKLTTVGALIEKARSTPFPGEHEALAVKAYGILAGYLNSLDPEPTTGPRRRERRLLNDRRARQAAVDAAADAAAADAEQKTAPTIDLTDSAQEIPNAASAPHSPPKPQHHPAAAAAYRGFCDARPSVGIRLDIAI